MEHLNDPLEAACARLDARIDWERRDRGALRPSLAPIEALLVRLGHPQHSFKSVHIAGTKGKGSVAALVAAGLGERTGVYASPHVERITERVRIGGKEVERDCLAAGIEAALDAATPAATWFDVFTAAAFWVLREVGVEWAVVEVGLGGRLDSTNVVQPRACAITSIDLEHTDVLGGTRAAIAGEKAGILKRGVPLVSGVAPGSEAGEVIAARAQAMDCPVTWVARGESLEETNRALAGALLAVVGADPGRLDDPDVSESARLPGRLERTHLRGVPVVLDGAHVPSSLEAVLEELSRNRDLRGPCRVVLAVGRDKDALGLLKTLVGRVDRVQCTSVGERQLPPQELAALAATLGLEAKVEPSPGCAVASAAAASTGGWVLVTGSLHLIGAVRGSLVTHLPPETPGCSPSAATSS